MSIASRLNISRISNGLTLDDLAKKAAVVKSGLVKMEAGERIPRVKTFISICNALAVTPDYLLQDTNKMTAVFAIEHLMKSIDTVRANNAIARMKCILDSEGN